MTRPVLTGPVAAALLLLAGGPARADACDALAGRVVTTTGAALAGRTGATVAFGAADADLMLLDCRAPARIVLRWRSADPHPRGFVLVGLAARALAGGRAGEAGALALALHRAAAAGGAVRAGRAGAAEIRCGPGPAEPFATACLVRRAPLRPARNRLSAGPDRR
ncbi:hypothetical protein [Methylobacterium oryzihabitans]|uniref:hypothetical protein n=1 Tax=Methylobacterium oryzihabitans TaxID=2499852 RepID=UPI001651D4A8|nr:hypothetical protein [Methylobacterium oryzihabitans]